MYKRSKTSKLFSVLRLAASFGFVICLFTVNGLPQAGTSTNQNFTTGAVIIPMDNSMQGSAGSCNGPNFNIRAYGLAARLLWANIPLNWAIANKATKDATDFTANATRYDAPGTGSDTQTCVAGGAAVAFSGGPLIIRQEYAALALTAINEFNAEITGGSAADNRVRVFIAQANFTAPVRYTLTHKPKIAVGPVNGGFGGTPNETLFEAARLEDHAGNNYYTGVPDNLIGDGACYTVATQAHATSAPNYTAFKNFVLSGGNFVVQCESITHYEQLPATHFQTSNGYNLFGNSSQFPARPDGTSSTALAYDNPAQPYNQFIGEFGSDQEGAVSEFEVTGGNVNFLPGALSAVRNTSSGNTLKHIAVARKLPEVSGAGGNVFTIGGHDYFRNDAWPGTSIENLNGQRMILNAAVLVPSARPGCGLDNPVVKGFKYVDRLTGILNDVNGNGKVDPGDKVRWTISFINDSLATVTSFQIKDTLNNFAGTNVTYVPGSLTLLPTNGVGTSATLNLAYTGTAPNDNMLATGILGPQGRIRVQITTTVNAYGTHKNQPLASGDGVALGTFSDTVDNGTFGTFGGYAPNEGSSGVNTVCQTQLANCANSGNFQTAALDPTGLSLFVPTAAQSSISGSVITSAGMGISRAIITVTDAATGSSHTVTTNTFGNFTVSGLDSGVFYIVSVKHNRYEFETDTQSFMVNDNVVGLVFRAIGPKGGPVAQPEPIKLPASKKAVTALQRKGL